MPLRILMRYLSNNEALIQKLAESYPMRRAAQLTAYLFHRGRALGEETMEKIKESEIADKAKHGAGDISNRAQSFTSRFGDELKSGFRELQEEIKRQQKPRR